MLPPNVVLNKDLPKCGIKEGAATDHERAATGQGLSRGLRFGGTSAHLQQQKEVRSVFGKLFEVLVDHLERALEHRVEDLRDFFGDDVLAT